MINSEGLNKIENTYADGKTSTININEMPYFDKEQYDFFDEKDFGKYIQDIERSVRMSFEYRQLISYLKNTEAMNTCTFLENLVQMPDSKIKIEIHHSPLTLYDIVSAVVKRRMHDKEDTDIFLVANEVMYLHYLGWVGLVPVSESVHELIHNQYIFVPTNIVRGNFRAFVDNYYDYISPDTLDALDNAEEMTKEYLEHLDQNNQISTQMNIFNIHQTYIKTGHIDKDSITNTRNKIKTRIDDIKTNKRVMYDVVAPENFKG